MPDYDDDRWVIGATNRWGTTGYYGEGWQRRAGVIESRGNAYRYPTEIAAQAAAYHARDTLNLFTQFSLEQLPERPKFKKTADGREGNT